MFVKFAVGIASAVHTIGILVRVFSNSPRDKISIPSRVLIKTPKCFLIPLCLILSIIRYGSRVIGAIQGKEWRLPLHLGVVAIEKGTFRSPKTTISQVYIYPTPPLPLECDTRSILKRDCTGLNLAFLFKSGCLTKAKGPSRSKAGNRRNGFWPLWNTKVKRSRSGFELGLSICLLGRYPLH